MNHRLEKSEIFESESLQTFAREYANWKELQTVCLTFDTDFAPEYMIENVLAILEDYQACATFFATHESEVLKKIGHDQRFEIGTHPNLLPGSTQGDGLKEIIDALQHWYPGMVGNRFHVLAYSYRDLMYLGENGFEYDISTVRFNSPYLLPSFHRDLDLVLLTYLWEDGVCENSQVPLELENINLQSPGIKIINFHPMNIFINGETNEARLRFLKENPNLLECKEATAQKYRQSGAGAEHVLRQLLGYLKERNVRTVCSAELATSYLRAVN